MAEQTMSRICTLLTGYLILLNGLIMADDRLDRAPLLVEAEARLKQIYDQQAYKPQTFAGKWLRDSSGYLVLEKPTNTSEPELTKYDVATGTRTVLLGGDQLIPEAASEPLAIQEFAQSPIPHQFLLLGQLKSTGQNRYWLFDSRSGSLRAISAEISRLTWEKTFSPDGDRLLVEQGHNLCVVNLTNGNVTPLTNTEGNDTLDNDMSAAWSPDGQQIAYFQSDFSKVLQRPIVHPNDPTYPHVSLQRYSRVGTPIPTLRVGVVSASGGDTQWLNIPADPGTFYINEVGWATNSQELLVEMASRGRDYRAYLLLNTKTQAVTKAYEETDPAWVDGSYLTNAGLEWIEAGNTFVLLSERGGWRQAYKISRDGKSQTLLTQDPVDIIARGPVDETAGWFYYLASPDNATQRYLYRVRVDGTGEPERLTPLDQPGTHRYDFSPDRKWAFHTYSTFDLPPVIDLIQLPSLRSLRVLQENAECKRRVSPLITRPTEFLQLDIGNGVAMDAWMIKPRHFDASKKYPVFVYVYGEPHAQTVLDDWISGQNHTMFHRMIADLGYLVVSIDGRGTPAPKGAAWRRAVYGSLGPLSTEEQAAGINELARLKPYFDSTRVGVWGWSGGGSNTLNALFRKPDVYHVGIAVVSKPQPHLYNAWFQEIFMRTPEVNPEGYRQAAAINFAEGLKGNLLIIHGTGETNTHIQIVEGLIDRLIELGKRFDYMVYPNRDHGMREGKGTGVHLRLLITRYLVEHLQPGPL